MQHENAQPELQICLKTPTNLGNKFQNHVTLVTTLVGFSIHFRKTVPMDKM